MRRTCSTILRVAFHAMLTLLCLAIATNGSLRLVVPLAGPALTPAAVPAEEVPVQHEAPPQPPSSTDSSEASGWLSLSELRRFRQRPPSGAGERHGGMPPSIRLVLNNSRAVTEHECRNGCGATLRC